MVSVLTLAVVASGMLSTASTTAHANPFCLVTNERTAGQYTDLQQAINDATSGDTLDVRGVCFGNFTIDGKTLTLRGVSTPARKYPTLDGTNTGSVLVAENAAIVTIKGLVITHGQADAGGGILMEGSHADPEWLDKDRPQLGDRHRRRWDLEQLRHPQSERVSEREPEYLRKRRWHSQLLSAR